MRHYAGTTGKFVVGGNWKCNGDTRSIAALVKQLNAGAIGLHADVEIICAVLAPRAVPAHGASRPPAAAAAAAAPHAGGTPLPDVGWGH